MSRAPQPLDRPGGRRFSPLWVTLTAAGVLALGLAVWLTRGAAAGADVSRFAPALFVLGFDIIPVSGWLIAAWGYGAVVRRGLSITWGSSLARPGPPGLIGADARSDRQFLPSPMDRRASAEPCPDLRVEFGVGVAVLLWLDHALGAAGVLQMGGSAGGWVLLCIGWLAALLSLRERIAARSLTWGVGGWSSLALLAAIPAVTVMLIAATSAPGWLWASEAYGYDVLEYHLQMPREWLRLGLLTPLTHNVYSFAPSYVEAAYYHLAVLLDPLAPRPLDGGIEAATACQLLHACLMLWAAREVALLARLFVSNWMALAAGAIAISVPWVVVTGSMAYDEAAVIGLLALCWRLAAAGPTTWRAFGLIGFLAGVACGAKLTALGGVVLPVGALLLIHTPAKVWWRAVIGCCAGGLIALGPHLVRNYVALGGANPLFPFLAPALGDAHWTAEQVARWNSEHGPHGGWTFRLGSLWEMAFAHAQWAGLWFAALAAAPVAWLRRAGRAAARDALIVLAVQLLFWLTLTHQQSRFLLPSLPPLVLLIVLGLEALRARWRWLAVGASVGLPAWLGAWSVHVYNTQRGGQPAMYIDRLAWRTGIAQPPLSRADAQQLASIDSSVYVNLFVPESETIYLLGDATPFYIARPVVWHTTWDTSPLGEIIRDCGDDQDAWTAALLDRGITLVLVNYSELDRLVLKDHWYDPILADVDVQGYFDAHAQPIAQWGPRVLYRLVAPSN